MPRILLLILLPALAGAAAPAPAPESDPGGPALPSGLTERVTVAATRLPAAPAPLAEVPAHVTIIDRERIERSGAATLQDLLALEAGVVLYDQVGNDLEKTLDLRGLATGAGTRVLLDGAPLNDSRNNALALELIPLAALERVEIVRGSTGALHGGGSEAGAIHLITRAGAPASGGLSVAAGSDAASRLAGDLGLARGRFDVFAAASREDSAGFRENSGGDLRRLAAAVGVDLGGGRRLALSAVDGRTDLGNPGALTAAELASDPYHAPFNQVDFSAQRLTQAALNYRGPLTARTRVSANAFARERSSRILSTGRSAALFGGFYLDSDAAGRGATAQVTHRRGRHELAAGAEWLEGETDARGYFTSPEDPGSVDPGSPDSQNTARRGTLALYAQERFRPVPAVGLVLGLRADRDRVRYEDALDPALDASRSFSELSLSAGATWQVAARHALYAARGEAFLPPTVEELFSFPLFFSNPDLKPEDSVSVEIGWRADFPRTQLTAGLFRLDTDDEIVFVPDPPPAFTGANRNIGRTRRRGLEASLRAQATRRLALFGTLGLIEAEIRSGADRGRDVPLVPGTRVAAGFDLELPARADLAVDALYVGAQVLDADTANAEARLAFYAVVNARAGWRPAPAGPRLYVEARNLFDRAYATRGIFAGEAFFTPAPGRRYLFGAAWRR